MRMRFPLQENAPAAPAGTGAVNRLANSSAKAVAEAESAQRPSVVEGGARKVVLGGRGSGWHYFTNLESDRGSGYTKYAHK